ncbi:pyridoxamine 5'-phosphate oxidase family protein [Nocardia gipuzkoensis]|uniref:pyridoxamine 5'-phosphate oxidase family protein n=1 Tax=Nocardia gipuzkoensis TaxID=2749991 RepID=UPI0038CDA474
MRTENVRERIVGRCRGQPEIDPPATLRGRITSRPMRTLRESEITDLLTRDVVAHLPTIDSAGYPHITPLWFVWLDDRFYLTSYADRPHLERMRPNPRVGLVIDVEDSLRADGERPNRQVRVIGTASLAPDPAGTWTERSGVICRSHRSRWTAGTTAPTGWVRTCRCDCRPRLPTRLR